MADYCCEKCGEKYDSPQALAGHKTGCGKLPWDNPELLHRLYCDEKLSLGQIADRWDDATRDKIRWQFQKHSIETRGKGEGRRLRNRSDVTISEVRGRLRLEFREFGEHRQFPLARLISMVEYSLDELDGKHVHHKNGCALDDRLENLEIRKPSDHHREHAPEEGPPTYNTKRRREIAEGRERDGSGRFVSDS